MLLKINIIGAGSVGHLYARALSSLGHQVNLYTRESAIDDRSHESSEPREHSEHKNNFANIRSLVFAVGTKKEHYKQTYSSLDHISKADFTLICVKSHALQDLLKSLVHNTDRLGNLLLVMNGLGLIEQTKNHFPNSIVLQAASTHGVYIDGQNINYTGSGKTVIGTLEPSNESRDKAVFEPLIDALNDSLPVCEWRENHSDVLWEKLLINCIINPITAIYNVNNGQLARDETINQKVCELVKELDPIIRKYLPKKSTQSLLDTVLKVAISTQSNISSMRQDLIKGKPTENDAITGYLLRKSADISLSLPKHQALYNEILNLERKSQNPSHFGR